MSRTPLTRVVTVSGLTVATAAAGLLFTAPAAFAVPVPTVVVTPGTLTAGQTFTVSGADCTNPEPNPAVFGWAGIGYGQMGDGDQVEPGADGTWSIQLTIPEGIPAGTYPITAGCDFYTEGDGFEYAATSVTVTVPGSTPTTTTTPTTAAPTGSTATADAKGVVTVTAAPGQSLTPSTAATVGELRYLRLTGYAAGEKVTVVLHSTPQTIGTFTADAQGVVLVAFAAPAGTEAGDHQLKVTRADGTVVSYPIRIAAAASGSGSELAYTGADVATPLIGGLALVVVGAGTTFAARRRSAGASQA